MCGIVSIFNIQEQTPELRQQALRMSQKIRHRGPDWSGIYCGGSAILAHERLSIVDPESGRQPLFAPDKKQVLAVNGEIYNHQDIRARFAGKYQYQTGSDCEVILSLYREMRADSDFDSLIYKGEDALHARISKMLEELNGIFAFALYDAERDEFLIARDPIGVIPLYIGYDKDGKVLVASELKALEGQCDHYEPFLPGHYYYSKNPGMKRYYTRDWFEYAAMQKKYQIDDTQKAEAQLKDAEPQEEAAVKEIHDALEASVKRQLMSDVPYGVLLSGGLDSSVISAIAQKYSTYRIENGEQTKAYWPRLHSFAVGLKGAGGMLAALIMGGVVCTALSMAGSFITDLKIGYWLGTTPKKQESWKFLGTLVSAATVGGVMMLLNQTYGFANGSLAAPQANAMAAVIDPLMNGVGAPWILYGIGAVLAILLTVCKIPALAFALGMFIPLELNVPLVVGGAINWFVTTRSKDASVNKERGEKGTLIASGFIAGGALMGVVSALLKFGGFEFSIADKWWSDPMSEVCSLIAYILLITYFIQATKSKKK